MPTSTPAPPSSGRERRQHVVIVDTREPMTVKTIVQAQLPDEIQLLALPEGDFALPDRDDCFMGIERKTVSDLLKSLEDGRFASQLTRMKSSYSIQGLIVEGSYRVTGEGYLNISGGISTRWSHTALQMALFSAQRQFPELFVLWSKNLGTTAEIIRVLAQRGYKGCFNDTSLFRIAEEKPGASVPHARAGVSPDSFFPARRSAHVVVSAPGSPGVSSSGRRKVVAPGVR